MDKSKLYKGIDLLELIFEFEGMTPNPNAWTINAQKGNLPRLIRLKQINSLLSAFFQPIKSESLIDKAKKLFLLYSSETIQTVLTGDFLRRKTIAEYSELSKFIIATLSETRNFETLIEKEIFEYELSTIHISELTIPYQRLIDYKKQIGKLLTFNSDISECSKIVFFSVYITDIFSSKLKNTASDVDKALELLINPNELSFTLDQLINEFNFPIEDLEEIDNEYW
jgi:hypothetical protein